MKIIKNKLIPFPGFSTINLFGVLFTRQETVLSETTLNHESIHTKQMKELLYVPFYLIYFVEWIVRLFQKRFNALEAYRAISFEQEAYDNEYDPNYLKERKPYVWFKYWKKNK